MLGLTSIASCPRPESMQIDAVSVDPQTNRVVVSWTPLSYNVTGYIIFRGTGAEDTDTIWDREQSRDTLQMLADLDLQFRLLAFNECDGVFENGGWSAVASRVFACQIEQLHCERQITISWGDASNSIKDIAHFEIWASIDSGDFFLAETVDASLSSATIGAFGHLEHYKIFVRAVSSNPTIYANSIADTLTLIVAPEPDFAYLKNVTVVNNNTVEIRTSVDVDVVWDSLFFFADNALVGAKSYADFRENNRILLPRIVGAVYHFQVSDTCGEIVSRSNYARPILLESDLQGTTVLLWFSEYYGWSNLGMDIQRYDIFEVRDGETRLHASRLPNRGHSFMLSDVDFAQIMTLSYFVVAYGFSLTDGTRDTTHSNVVHVISRTEIPVHFPTGFVPGGYTPTYFPIFVPMPNDKMQFAIFNTFGQTVFSTTNPYHTGWDGTFNNADVQPGIYMFHFELTRNNVTIRRRGTITVIR